MRTKTKFKQPPKENIHKKATTLSVVGEETRLRIMCLMFERGEACVSEIADALDISVACASHHLQVMHDNGIFSREKRGTTRCYILSDTDDVKKLRAFVCS